MRSVEARIYVSEHRAGDVNRLCETTLVLGLATGRFAGEGFDDPRLDTLFLALPVSWKGTLIQYAGRLHRQSPEKTEVRIYDYVDASVPLLERMFQKRLRGYRAMGYVGDRGAKDEPTG
jgi:superfamily II DNA or RNA helicase